MAEEEPGAIDRRAGSSSSLYRPLVSMLARGARAITVRYGTHERAMVVCAGIRRRLREDGAAGVSVDCRGLAVVIRREGEE